MRPLKYSFSMTLDLIMASVLVREVWPSNQESFSIQGTTLVSLSTDLFKALIWAIRYFCRSIDMFMEGTIRKFFVMNRRLKDRGTFFVKGRSV